MTRAGCGDHPGYDPRVPANLPPELAGLLIGFLFVVIGAASLIAGLATPPRRAPIAIWFGVFSVMYGVRLAARSTLLQLATGWPPVVFRYADSLVTYLILVPAGLFTESITGPGWRGIVRRTWQITAVCMTLAALRDLVTRPGATMWINAPIVLTSIPIYLWQVMVRTRAAGPWTANGRLVAGAGLLFTAVAFFETVYERAPFGLPFNLEPIAMLLLTVALGWLVLRRVGAQAAGYTALSRELTLAREIQQSLLPREMPRVPGVTLSGAFVPMSAVAGDFYDIVLRGDDHLVAIVADVSGHGMPAALVASMVKVAFAAEVERERDPGAILGGINRALTGKFERAYVTACCISLPPARDRVAYAAAGHPPAMMRRRAGAVERVDHGSPALTLLPGTTYTSVALPFERGDRLVLFTDGLLEATRRGDDDAFFGDAQLVDVVARLDHGADACRVVLDAYRRWIGPGTPPSDDVTLVVVERTA
jgi:sigma-B regulation protein RsbU (phosphoserine phosphatase)